MRILGIVVLLVQLIQLVESQALITVLGNFLQCAAVHQSPERVNRLGDPAFRKFPVASPWQGPGWRVLNGSVATEGGLVTTLYCVYPTSNQPIVQTIPYTHVGSAEVFQALLSIQATYPTPILTDESSIPTVGALVEFIGSSAPPINWQIAATLEPPIVNDGSTTSWVIEKGSFSVPSFGVPPETTSMRISLTASINGSVCIRSVSLSYSHLGNVGMQERLRWAQLALFLTSIFNSAACAIILSRHRRRWLLDWGNIILLRRIPIYGGSRWVPIVHILAASPWIWDALRNVLTKNVPLIGKPTLGPLIPIVYVLYVFIQAYAWWGPLLCWSAIVTAAGKAGRRRRVQASALGIWCLIVTFAQLYVYATHRVMALGPRIAPLSIAEIILASSFYLMEFAWFVRILIGAQPAWIKAALAIFQVTEEQIAAMDDSFEAIMYRDCSTYVKATLLRLKQIGPPVPAVAEGSKALTPNFNSVSPWPADIVRFPPTTRALLVRFARSVSPKSIQDFDDPFWHTLSIRLILGITLFPVQAVLLLTQSATVWVDGLGAIACLLAAFTDPTVSGVVATANSLIPILTPIVIVIVILLMFLVIHHQFATVRNYIVVRARLKQGDYGMIPTGKLAFNHGDDRKLRGGIGILQAVQFVGYCVGFGLFGLLWTIIVTLLLFVMIALLVLAVVAVPSVQKVIVDYLTSSIFIAAVFAAILSVLLRIAQRLLLAYTSLIPGSTTHVRYNSPFLHLDYVFIYVDAILGVLAFLKRLLLGLFSSAFYATRVDITIITDDWKTSDGGLASFLAMAVMDHAYQNDIVLYFAMSLIRQRRGRMRLELDDGDVYNPDSTIARDSHNAQDSHNVPLDMRSNVAAPVYDCDEVQLMQLRLRELAEKHMADEAHRARLQARTRWFLAYTLIQNPQLGIFRKHAILAERQRSQPHPPGPVQTTNAVS